jgi:hypothetical protein
LDDAQLVHGQLASYAAAHYGRQFRVHIFSVLICVRFARFIRWDLDGATVTWHFDYINNADNLATFFWRYALLDRRQHGYNTSVLAALPADIQHIWDVKSVCEMTTLLIINFV